MSKEKQIEEMACTMCGNKNICVGEGVEKCILYPQMRRYADRAYREGYRKQKRGEWISVEERLPEQYGPFLIADDKGNMEVATWTKQFGWFSGGNRVKRVTHWMPMPEPPKGAVS